MPESYEDQSLKVITHVANNYITRQQFMRNKVYAMMDHKQNKMTFRPSIPH